MKKRLFFLFITLTVCADVDINKDFVWDDVYPPRTWVIKRQWLKTWAKDFLLTFRNTVSFETVKILGFTLPVYFGVRSMDKDLHSCFYKSCCHSNYHQVPKPLRELSDKGVPALIGVLSSFSFLSNNPELRLTSFAYTQAVIAYWITKNIFKNSQKCNFNERPKNENFCQCDDCTAHGGFPSGHTGEAVLAAVLFGLRHGPAWGVPLGAFAALVFGVSISANRHYASQVIGGFGLGLIFASASYRVIQHKFPEDLGCSLWTDKYGRAGVTIDYSF